MTKLWSWAAEINEHRWLAIRALVVGWIALFAVRAIVLWLVKLDDWLFVRGLLDVRAWWPDPKNPVPHLFIGAVAQAAMGWTVGYFHREHRTSMVLLYCFSLLLFLDLPRFIPALMTSFSSGMFWLIVVVDFAFLRVPIIVGGIWGVRDRSPPVERAFTPLS